MDAIDLVVGFGLVLVPSDEQHISSGLLMRHVPNRVDAWPVGA